MVLLAWYSYLCELGTLSWWSLKQRHWWKLKSNFLKAHDHDETVTKHMIFPFYRNTLEAQSWDVPKHPGVWIFTLWNQNLELTPSCVFFLLYPSKTDKNVIIQNTPHHQTIIIWCQMLPHDAPMTSCSFWQEFLCMHLAHWVDTVTQIVDTKADTLIHPLWSGKLQSQVHTLTLISKQKLLNDK